MSNGILRRGTIPLSPFTDWLMQHYTVENFGTRRALTQGGRQETATPSIFVLTSITESVSFVIDTCSYVIDRDQATTVSQRKRYDDLAQTSVRLAIETIQKSKKSGVSKLNADRDGKRGQVITLGALASQRFERMHAPEIVLRMTQRETVDHIERICTGLYYDNLPIAPIARIGPTTIIALYIGPNLMSALGNYNGESRESIERKLWGDICETSKEIAKGVRRHYRHTWQSPRAESAKTLCESVFALQKDPPGFFDRHAVSCESKKLFRRLCKDETWPFVDPVWRNFGIRTDLNAYAEGKDALWFYDYDRLDHRSSQQFNLAHIVYEPWKHISFDERLKHTGEFFLEAALYYLTCRVGRARKYGLPRTDAVRDTVEQNHALTHRDYLQQLLEQPDAQRQYPAIVDALTNAKPW